MRRPVEVELQGHDLVVTMPGTSFAVAYRMSPEGGKLDRSDWWRDDHAAPITLGEFLIEAWKAANDKARELEWIV
jgi:hypothetical protein